MATGLFSTYSAGENRVTASILAVLRCLSLDRIEHLIGAMLEQSEFELVQFRNQPAGGGSGVPDAIITSSCRILLETKVRSNAVKADQLRRHLRRLEDGQESNQAVLVITPDDAEPAAFKEIRDARLAWTSFESLDQAIDEIIEDRGEVISEREAFLLRELQGMLAREGLLKSADDVLVVPARHAWGEYQRHHAYVCQPNRAFQPVSMVAFYSNNQIHPVIPQIIDKHEAVVLDPSLHNANLAKLIERLLQDPAARKKKGATHKILVLSGPEDPRTIRLSAPIVNDLKSVAGRRTAFVQNQRYVSVERLKITSTTSELG